ncbi:hypothetical protein GCM10027088_45810 [Nocardia goodfellowii]
MAGNRIGKEDHYAFGSTGATGIVDCRTTRAGVRGIAATDQREFAILSVAVHRTSEYIWYAHERVAGAIGISTDVIEQVKLGQAPTDVTSSERSVWEFTNELTRHGDVPDPVYRATVIELGHGAVKVEFPESITYSAKV